MSEYTRARNIAELEDRIRDYTEKLEHWQAPRSYPSLVLAAQQGGEAAEEASRDHWMYSGMSEAYDNVLDNLYGILGEER
jgi:hypothetical protein